MESSGSPPHGRGKGISNVLVSEKLRITPAWAGKRWRCIPCFCIRWDHPRVGGEKWLIKAVRLLSGDHPRMGGEKSVRLFCIPSRLGSPPRRRGKGIDSGGHHTDEGITPAWAGKRWTAWAGQGASVDHPRMGGEKLTAQSQASAMAGSPPRGRGKILCGHAGHVHHRITPAWAGKRKHETTQKIKYGDHPRLGGEKSGTS